MFPKCWPSVFRCWSLHTSPPMSSDTTRWSPSSSPPSTCTAISSALRTCRSVESRTTIPTDTSVIWKRMFSPAFVSLPDLLETHPLRNVHLRRPAKLLLPQQSSGANGCSRGERTFSSWSPGDSTDTLKVAMWATCGRFPQVYVRRAYIAYELNSVQHRQLKDNTCIVEFQFMLPTSHPNR